MSDKEYEKMFFRDILRAIVVWHYRQPDPTEAHRVLRSRSRPIKNGRDLEDHLSTLSDLGILTNHTFRQWLEADNEFQP